MQVMYTPCTHTLKNKHTQKITNEHQHNISSTVSFHFLFRICTHSAFFSPKRTRTHALDAFTKRIQTWTFPFRILWVRSSLLRSFLCLWISFNLACPTQKHRTKRQRKATNGVRFKQAPFSPCASCHSFCWLRFVEWCGTLRFKRHTQHEAATWFQWDKEITCTHKCSLIY